MNQDKKIKQIVKKYNLTRDDFWNLTGKVWIIKHDAVQKIAKEEQVIFDKPTIVEHSREHCVLMGSAHISAWDGEIEHKIEMWTFGEADRKTNCKNAYIFAMAEKRLKDRLALKLIDAYEYGIYSDTESDDFKKNNKVQYEATASQQKYVYKLLEHTAFTTGDGLKLKEKLSGLEVPTKYFGNTNEGSGMDKTRKLIDALKAHIERFETNQKDGKAV